MAAQASFSGGPSYHGMQQPVAGSGSGSMAVNAAGLGAGALVGVSKELPTAPRVVCISKNANFQMPMLEMKVAVEIHISVAFVRVYGRWKNTTPSTVNCVFELPFGGRATVTSGVVHLDNGQGYRTTVVGARDLAEGMASGAVKENSALVDAMDAYLDSVGHKYARGEHDPDCFRLPFTSVPSNATATVDIAFFQQLDFNNGTLRFLLPFVFPDQVLLQPLDNTTFVHVTMHTGTTQCEHTGATHALDITYRAGNSIVMQTAARSARQNLDFEIAYKVWTPSILANLIVQPDPGSKSGSFALFVSPPQPSTINLPVFPRRVVFVLDNSGSMAGTPLQACKDALISCLRMLTPNDAFALCVFNHETTWWSPYGTQNNDTGPSDYIGQRRAPQSTSFGPPIECLAPCIPDIVERAESFVRGIRATGLTDIMKPIKESYHLLTSAASHDHTPGVIVPFIFFLTDGAVPNEREVCSYVQGTTLPARIYTLGIGQFCNSYFLRMLAQLGRGHSEINLRGRRLKEDIVGLMNRMSMPVLLDVTLGMQLESLEVYPNPIPDLFVGSPVIISGRYQGVFPASIVLAGRIPPAAGHATAQGAGIMAAYGIDNAAQLQPLADGSGMRFQMHVQTNLNANIPVEKVFLKQRLDLMIALHWLSGEEEGSSAAQEIVRESVANEMPCPYTTMVLVPDASIQQPIFEPPPPPPDPVAGGAGAGAGVGAAWGSGRQPEQPNPKPKPAKPVNTGKTGTKIAAIAGVTGGVMVLGAAVGAAVAFGSIQATTDGLMSFADGLGGFDFSGIDLDIDSCGCLGCCLPDDAMQQCGSCWGGHEGVLDGCFGSCGNCFGDCGDSLSGACGDCFSSISNCCGDLKDCGGCGDLFSSCGEGCSGVCGSIGGAFSGCFGAIGDCAGGCCNGYTDFCSNISCNCDGICGSIGDCLTGIMGCCGACMGCMGDICGTVTDGMTAAVDSIGDICGD